jgi:hypothetical protein
MRRALNRWYRRNRRRMWRHMRDRVRRNGNRRYCRAGVPQPGGSGQRRPDRERTWGRMSRGNLGQRRKRHFLRQRLGRRLEHRLLGVCGSGQNMAVLLGLFVRCGGFGRGLLLVPSGAPVFFPTRARQALAQQFRNIFVDRTGVGLLFGDTEFRQEVQDRARFYLELPRQFINPNFLHTHGRALRPFHHAPRPQPGPFAPASTAAGQFSVEPLRERP